MNTRMNTKSRTKLTEECGELVTILAKIEAFGGFGVHWDGKGSLELRLSDEVADVIAACVFVININNLDDDIIRLRINNKIRKFEYWNSGGRYVDVPDTYVVPKRKFVIE